MSKELTTEQTEDVLQARKDFIRYGFDANRALEERLTALARHNGFRNPGVPAATRLFCSRVFCYSTEDKRTIWAFKGTGDGTKVLCKYIVSVKARGGTLYFYPSSRATSDEPYYECYTAHFFDRYKVRMGLDVRATREQVIRHFLAGGLQCSGPGVTKLAERTSEIVTDVYGGLGIGVRVDDINVVKTFISYDMLFDAQRKDLERFRHLSEEANKWFAEEKRRQKASKTMKKSNIELPPINQTSVPYGTKSGA